MQHLLEARVWSLLSRARKITRASAAGPSAAEVAAGCQKANTPGDATLLQFSTVRENNMNGSSSWMTSEAEQRLLDFVAFHIVEVARTNSRLSQFQVALWLARVVLGARK
jgi:hypothetical protein